MKLKSDKCFLQFLSSGKRLTPVAVALVLGVLLILIGSNKIEGAEKTTSASEIGIEELCSMTEGVGECRVHITYREDSGEELVYAVAIICEGADSVAVRERLTSLVCSLYGIGANRVEILKMKK